MNYHQVQERAALIARAQGITQGEALSQMSKAASAARKRRRGHCRTEITPAQAEFKNVEPPARRYWWQEDN